MLPYTIEFTLFGTTLLFPFADLDRALFNSSEHEVNILKAALFMQVSLDRATNQLLTAETP
jgi:hypothetical protein